MLKKLAALAVVVGVAVTAYKLGVLTEREKKKTLRPGEHYLDVPEEYLEEAKLVRVKAAEKCEDDLSDIDVLSVLKFDDKRVYTVDACYKVFGVIVTNEGDVEVGHAEWNFN